MHRARIAILTAAALLALPGTALAGGAGDDQYQDPFGDEPAPSEQPAQAQQEEAPAPATEAPAEQAPAQAESAQSAPTAAPALPRTGSDTMRSTLIALGGGVLLLAGLALRRRTADGARG